MILQTETHSKGVATATDASITTISTQGMNVCSKCALPVNLNDEYTMEMELEKENRELKLKQEQEIKV